MTVTSTPTALQVEFCDEWFDVDPTVPFVIGREGHLVIDENLHLHRRFLELSHRDGIWWLVNLGRQIAATVSDDDGRFQAWLAPGAHLPVVFETLTVRFAAGPTSYAVTLHLSAPPFVLNPSPAGDASTTTIGQVPLEGEHLLLVLALAEPVLRDPAAGRATLPTSAAAAARLGWPLTKFNRKLDHICQRLKKAGVNGVHGDVASLASDRRARLVEYSLATRAITAADLVTLEAHVAGVAEGGEVGE